MLKSIASIVFGAVVSVLAFTPFSIAHAQGSCQFYETTGEVVDVFKTPSAQGGYFELLERGDVTCISKQQQSDNRSWGFIEYRKDKNGQKVVVKGWVDLQFVAPQGGVTQARETQQPEQPSTLPAAVNPQNVPADEVAYWNTVRDSRDPDLIRLYLNKFPDGTFADLALAMIAKLEKGTVTQPSAKQTKAYVPSTQKSNRKTTKKSSKPTRKTTKRKIQRKKKTTQKKTTQRRVTRRRTKKCRYESQFECLKRGGFTTKGRCDVQVVCR